MFIYLSMLVTCIMCYYLQYSNGNCRIVQQILFLFLIISILDSMSFMTLPKVYNILKNDFHPLKINIFSTYTPPPILHSGSNIILKIYAPVQNDVTFNICSFIYIHVLFLFACFVDSSCVKERIFYNIWERPFLLTGGHSSLLFSVSI